MKQHGAYMASPANKTTSAIIEVTINKSLQFQVNQLNIAQGSSIIWRPKNSFHNLNFYSFRTPDPNIFIQDPFTTSTSAPLPTFQKNTNG